jgi:hypothetical protein
MKKEELLKYCRYYKGEETPPANFDNIEKMWWSGEKLLLEKNRDPDFWNRLSSSFDEAYKSNLLSGLLTNKAIPVTNKKIIFFLDLWHGRSFPYDSLDIIFSYWK